MNRRNVGTIVLGLGAALGGSRAEAQGFAVDGREHHQVYGTSWGVASYGTIRTTSDYPSPFGLGYGYGTRPQGFVPSPWGTDLWQRGMGGTLPRVGVYGVPNRYRTFPYPYPPGPPAYGPSIGEYAPGFGPTLRSPTPH